jgi:hypothetical protein
VHATDPDLLEAKFDQSASKGCIRVSASLNQLLDHYGALDRAIEEAARPGKRPWVLRPDRETELTGRYWSCSMPGPRHGQNGLCRRNRVRPRRRHEESRTPEGGPTAAPPAVRNDRNQRAGREPVLPFDLDHLVVMAELVAFGACALSAGGGRHHQELQRAATSPDAPTPQTIYGAQARPAFAGRSAYQRHPTQPPGILRSFGVAPGDKMYLPPKDRVSIR